MDEKRKTQKSTRARASGTLTTKATLLASEITADRASASLIATLREQIPFEEVIDVIRRALTAESVTRAGTVIEDSRTRLAAATLYFAYVEGKPVERQEIVNVHLDGKEALERRLSESPQMIAALRKTLDQAASKLTQKEASVVTPVLNADESSASVRGETSSGEES